MNLPNAQQPRHNKPLGDYPLHLRHMHDILDRIDQQQRVRNGSSALRKIHHDLLQPQEQTPKTRLHHRRIRQTARRELERRRPKIYTTDSLICRNLYRTSSREQRIRRNQTAEVKALNIEACGVGVDVGEKDNAWVFGRWSACCVVWWGVWLQSGKGVFHVIQVHETEVVVRVGYSA